MPRTLAPPATLGGSVTDANKYQRAIELAQRARELEHELTQTRNELQAVAGEIATGLPAVLVSAGIEIDHIVHNDEPQASLAARALLMYKRNPGKKLTAEQVGAMLGIKPTDTKKLNLLRQYLNRLFDRGELKRVERGVYVLAAK